MSNYIDLTAITSMIKVEKCEIKELGGHVFVKEMSGTTLALLQTIKQEQYLNTLLMHSLVDEEGNRVFGQADQLKSFLDKLPVKAVTALSEAINKVNGLDSSVDVNTEAKN